MSPNHQRARESNGLGAAITEFFGIFVAAGLLCVWFAMGARGAEVLDMPAWSWSYALIATMVAFGLLRVAQRTGQVDAKVAFSVSKIFGLVMVGGLGVFILMGLPGGSTSSVPGALGAVLDDAIPRVGRAIAWGCLVGVPSIAVIATGSIAWGAFRASPTPRTD